MNKIQKIFESIQLDDPWSIKLLTIKVSKKTGITYSAHEIFLEPANALHNHVKEIVNRYIQGENALLKKYSDVVEYDGTADALFLYKMNKNNPLINGAYMSLVEKIGSANIEGNPLAKRYSAYVITGISDEKPIYMFTMQSPFINMKKKHKWDGAKFVEIKDPILSLRPSIDAIIYGDEVYMFSMAAENLFQLERAYKKVCTQCVNSIASSGIIENIEIFESIANSGSNPRRFVSYDDKYLNYLNNKKIREEMGKKFNIPMVNGKFDTSDEKMAERFIKLICRKGMLDPFEETAVEVSSARDWI